jgi:hypothetical protein
MTRGRGQHAPLTPNNPAATPACKRKAWLFVWVSSWGGSNRLPTKSMLTVKPYSTAFRGTKRWINH